jgi:hypothetical protein
LGNLRPNKDAKIIRVKSCGLISLLCCIKKFQVTESSSANRTKNIAQQYFCVIERTPQEEILEGFSAENLAIS